VRWNVVRLGDFFPTNKRRLVPPDRSGTNQPPSLNQTATAKITITAFNGHVGLVGADLTQTVTAKITITAHDGALGFALRQRYTAKITISSFPGAVIHATNAVTLFIDGVDRTALLIDNTLNIVNQLSQAATATFALWDKTGAVPAPAVGQEVTIYRHRTRIFGGGVEQPVQTAFQALTGHLFAGAAGGSSGGGVSSATGTGSGGVQCTDFSYLLLRRYVGAYYPINAFLSNVVQDIVNNYLAADGFTFDDSDGDPNIDMGPLLFNWVTVQQAFNTISSNTGWDFSVDYYKVIRFYPAGSGTGPAPFNIADNDGHLLAETLNVEYFRGQYRNRQGIRSPTQSSFLWKDIFSVANPGPFPNTPQAPDGIRTNFITRYGILGVPLVFVDNVPQIVISLLDVVGFPGPWDWYYIPQQGFPAPAPGVFQNPSHTPLSSAHVLTVNYSSQLSPIYWVQDNAQIAARAAIEGNTGVYEDVQDAPSTTDPGAIAAYAAGLLARYGSNGIPYQVSYTTDTDGLFAGMLQEIVTANPPINLLAGQIVAVQIRDVDGTFLRYGVTVASAQYQGNWTQFFAALVTASQFPQPGNFNPYEWTIGPSVPGVTNPGSGTGTQPGTRIVTNAVELIQSFQFTNPTAVVGINQITLLINGSGVFSLQIEYASGETGTKTVFVPSSVPLRVFAGDVLAIFVGGAGAVKDGVAKLTTAIAVT
jgi:hypothetical protein